jgi:hypothetical protein
VKKVKYSEQYQPPALSLLSSKTIRSWLTQFVSILIHNVIETTINWSCYLIFAEWNPALLVDRRNFNFHVLFFAQIMWLRFFLKEFIIFFSFLPFWCIESFSNTLEISKTMINLILIKLKSKYPIRKDSKISILLFKKKEISNQE